MSLNWDDVVREVKTLPEPWNSTTEDRVHGIATLASLIMEECKFEAESDFTKLNSLELELRKRTNAHSFMTAVEDRAKAREEAAKV